MMKCTSVPDPDPDTDPYVFGPPGSAPGSFSQMYGSEDRIRIWIRTKISRIRNTDKL